MTQIKVALLCLCLTIPLSSKAFLFIDPINLIENTISANNSVQSLYNQIVTIKRQVETYKRNFTALGQFHYQDLGSTLQQLDEITRQGQSLSFTMQNVDSQFQKLYPNYSNQNNLPNYQQSYQQWNQSTSDTLQNSLQAIGVNMQSIQQEDALLKQLQSQSQTAQGRLQVIQVTNEIANENIRQLQTLKQLIATQANAQTAYMAHELSQRSYQQKALLTIINNTPSQFPTYQNNPEFGKLH